MKAIEVVAAVIQKENKVLATRRNYGEFQGMWEFPGGKIENDETREQALKREILEELNIQIDIDHFFTTIEYDYPQFHLVMHCYLCHLPEHEHLTLNVHDQIKWIDKKNLNSIDWLPADIPVAKQIIEHFE